MKIDLHEIIGVPGSSVSFDYEPDLSDTALGSVKAVEAPSRAVGSIRNAAGVLIFSADVNTTFLCVCARCLKEFRYPVCRHITAVLAEDEQEGDNPDVFPIYGDYADADEIIVTDFVLNMEQKMLCREDCKGLCEKCGSDLNNGPCSCTAERDPRLSVLGQLLEKD